MAKTILTSFQRKLLDILAIDPLLIGSQMRKVTTLTEPPKMLKPFDTKDMQKFFLSLAKQLESEIFKD